MPVPHSGTPVKHCFDGAHYRKKKKALECDLALLIKLWFLLIGGGRAFCSVVAPPPPPAAAAVAEPPPVAEEVVDDAVPCEEPWRCHV